MTVLQTAFGPPGSVPQKALFWSTRLLEWSTVVTLHCWLLSIGKGRRLPIHPSVKEQIVGPVAAWTSKLSKQACRSCFSAYTSCKCHLKELPQGGHDFQLVTAHIKVCTTHELGAWVRIKSPESGYSVIVFRFNPVFSQVIKPSCL